MQTTPHPNPPDLPTIIQRYLNGESIQVLAKECGKHRMTLYRWMLAAVGDKHYYDLVTDALVTRIADADAELDDPTCDIARAREKARYSRMDFERRRPHLYGPKQETSGSQKVIVLVQRASDPSIAQSSSYDVSSVTHEQLPLSGDSLSPEDSSMESTPSENP